MSYLEDVLFVQSLFDFFKDSISISSDNLSKFSAISFKFGLLICLTLIFMWPLTSTIYYAGRFVCVLCPYRFSIERMKSVNQKLKIKKPP